MILFNEWRNMNVAESLNLNTELPNIEFQFKQFGESVESVIIGLHGWTGDEHSLITVSIGVRFHWSQTAQFSMDFTQSTIQGTSNPKRIFMV